ncbi:peptidase domain-containing ABC transporter [Sporosarcina aquimarina]|uniref:Peptidase domain-containing ABC transporter n=1 Tax=Sporosarcina aquimarina TaxID=114975 RepID=A0ABU4FW18_9BACL|nr:peptidase domain-containing ABC transporter [Sporosarcina aquimarina]MDW0108899.1 peptidase domain-containing ABC transporter [Sporosarcina aquimarina]
MAKIKLVQQAEHSECGLASLTMLMNYHGMSTSLPELRNTYGVPRGGFKISEMMTILEDHGFEAKAYKVHTGLEQLQVPCIAFWNNRHYVVIEKVKKSKVCICDPATGRRWISKEEAEECFSNIVIQVDSQNEEKPRASENKASFLLGFLNSSFKKPLFFLLFLTIGIQGLMLIVPIVTKYLVDQSITVEKQSIGIIMLLSLVVLLGYYALQVGRGFIIAQFQKIFDDKLMSLYMEKLLQLPLPFFSNRSTGELIFRSNLSVYIRQILTQKAVLLLVDSVFLLFYTILMWNYSPTLAMITVVIAMTMVIISVLNTQKVRQFIDLEMIEQAKVQKNITEIIEGIETVKSTGSEQTFFKRWQEDFHKQLKITNAKERFSAVFLTIPQTLQFGLPLLLLLIGLYFVQEQSLTMGTVVAFLTLASSFINPVMGLANVYNDFVLLHTYFNKIEEIITHPTQQDGTAQLDSFEKVSLNNVTYQYSKFDEPVLQDVNLTIERSEKVAIVGESGSGKSTLLKLMAGLLQQTSGDISYNDESLVHIQKDSFNKQVAYTNQQAMIFNDSIEQNIVLGRTQEANKEYYHHLQDVLVKSDVFSIIEKLPLGIKSILSEQGANLSGGQRQKIALARSLFKKPELHLLDEPTSALDNISERHVMESLLEEDATCIVVAHRLQTIQHVDRIIVLKNGKIVGEGTHQQLIASNLTYRQLYNEEKRMENAS